MEIPGASEDGCLRGTAAGETKGDRAVELARLRRGDSINWKEHGRHRMCVCACDEKAPRSLP